MNYSNFQSLIHAIKLNLLKIDSVNNIYYCFGKFYIEAEGEVNKNLINELFTNMPFLSYEVKNSEEPLKNEI